MKSKIIFSLQCILISLLTSCGKPSHDQIRYTSTPIPPTIQARSSTPTISPSFTPNPPSTHTPTMTLTVTHTPSPSTTPFLFAKTPLTPLHNIDTNQSLVRLKQIKIPSKYSAIMYFSPYHPVMFFTGTGLLVKRLDLRNNDYLPDLLGPIHFSPYVLTTSPDGLLIAGNDNNRVIVWDIQSGNPVEILEPSINTLKGLYFTNDNDTLVAADSNGNIFQWDRWSWERFSTIELNSEQKRVIFVPDNGGALILDDVEGVLPIVALDGRPIGSIELPTQSYRFVSVSEDGKRLMIHVNEGVRVYEIATGEEVLFLSLEGVRSVAVTPNWSLFVASDADHNVHVIDLLKGDILLTQKMDVSAIRSLAISPAGNLLGLYVIDLDQKTPYIELWGFVGESETD